MKNERDSKKKALTDQEMRKRLYQEATAGPLGTETSLSRREPRWVRPGSI